MHSPRPQQQRQPPQWLRDALASLAKTHETKQNRQVVITTLRKWLAHRLYPFVERNTVDVLYAGARSVGLSRAGVKLDASVKQNGHGPTHGLEEMVQGLNVLARDVIWDVVFILGELHQVDAAGSARAMEIMEGLIFGNDEEVEREFYVLDALVNERDAVGIWKDSGQGENDVDKKVWKDQVGVLEKKIDSLEEELKNLKEMCMKNCGDMSKSFDFWAKLVLSELHTQSAADAAARKEFDERIGCLEECVVGLSCDGRNKDKKGKGRRNRKKGSAGEDTKKNDCESAVKQGEVARSNEQSEARTEVVKVVSNLGKDPTKGGKNCATNGLEEIEMRTGTDLEDSEDQDLMLAFRKALGSHFTSNPGPKAETRVFRNGKWQWIPVAPTFSSAGLAQW